MTFLAEVGADGDLSTAVSKATHTGASKICLEGDGLCGGGADLRERERGGRWQQFVTGMRVMVVL